MLGATLEEALGASAGDMLGATLEVSSGKYFGDVVGDALTDGAADMALLMGPDSVQSTLCECLERAKYGV
jgi:hypothetical protein